VIARRLIATLVGFVTVALAAYVLVLAQAPRPPVLITTAATVPPPSKAGPPAAKTSTRGLVAPRWIAQMSTRTGIPAPAMRAYAVAQLTSPCKVGWTTLAGIGWVESAHGTIGERVLQPDGHSSSAILGPALDGRGRVAALRSTSVSRQWHGDPVWDHAVGPMQFLPTTWETWGVDGDGDGVADPNDLDDAALAAADYLCADGYDLSTGSGWSAAVLSYNHAASYVRSVHDAAVVYDERAAG